VGFQLLLDRLRYIVRDRVKNGHLTERQLARMTATSQPHLHNVLKGIRALTPELADTLLPQLNLSMEELLEGVTEGKKRPRVNAPDVIPAFLPFWEIKQPAAIRLDADPRMAPRFQAGDVAIFDESTAARTELDSRATYLVNYRGSLVVRYIRWGGKRLYLVAEDALTDPLRWDFVFMADGNILEIVRGRIVWICRQLET
jgi:hypothetical protein